MAAAACLFERQTVALDNAQWRVVPGRRSPRGLARSAAGVPVSLPHCWNAHEEYIPGREPSRGWMTYHAGITLERPLPGLQWRLRSDGFYGRGMVWLNGRKIGRFNADYIGLDVAVPATVLKANNHLVIQVCNRHSRRVLPCIADPDFHLYGGLGGGLHLLALPRPRLLRDHCGIHVETGGKGEVTVFLAIANQDDGNKPVEVSVAVADPDGKQVAATTIRESPAGGGGPAICQAPLTIPRPLWWSPDTPHLYTVSLELRGEGEPVDRISWTTGLRTIRFDGLRGCLVNGKPVRLRGVNRHENLPGFGFALPRPLHEADVRRIKEMGLNFVRLSHYPQSPAFLDACDRLGLLVYAEVCSWKRINHRSWLTAAGRQMERMIRRDRHHPSIILWGLGNEGRDLRAFRRLRALARALDPSRPSIYAENHAYRARRKKTRGITEVSGVNYEIEALSDACKTAPSGCAIVTECANSPHAGRGNLAREIEQTRNIQSAIEKTEAAGPGVAGWALWCFADYATPRKRRWYRECGVVDGWRCRKISGDWLRARYAGRPFLKVAGDWSFRGGGTRLIVMVTNCEELSLRREGGREEIIKVPLPDLIERQVVFDGCPLRVSGRHADGTILEKVITPWHAAAGFRLRVESRAPVAGCRLEVFDANGTVAADYEGEAVFSLPPGVRASLVGGNRIPVRGGQAVFHLELPRGSEGAVIRGQLDDFPPQSISLPPDTCRGDR